MICIGNNLLVKELPKEDMSKGGIIIPETAKQRPGKAKVVFVSEDISPDFYKNMPATGNTILMSPDCGHPVYYENEDHLMITINDVQAIL